MQTIQKQLQKHIDSALQTLGIDTTDVSADALRVVPTQNAQFGDYQWNGALPLAKTSKQNPRILAQQIIDNLSVSEISQAPEIAGAGFVNFRLKTDFLEDFAKRVLDDARLGVPMTGNPQTFVVDFSAPNVAKPMHVGHIRSTVIGDAIQRLLRFAGHNVVTDNHIGDWGTQFGKIIVGWKNHLDADALARDAVEEMGRLYKLVNDQAENDATVEENARHETLKLQNGDEENLAIWNKLRDLSQIQFDEIYGRLDIGFDVTLGESFYNAQLHDVVETLQQLGIARQSEGAIAVFSESDEPRKNDPFWKNQDGEWQAFPLLVQKSDGASLYGTTDLATIRYRAQTWQPDAILYVVDARQSLHFQQVFATAKRWRYSSTRLQHIAFGTILGDDRTPLKTRSGAPPRLQDLLDEAESRALEIVREKNPDLPEDAQKNIARVVGIGAIKYADLSGNRLSDYVFSWDKMLALQGNSAPYLLYAFVRIRSILRRAQSDDIEYSKLEKLTLQEPAEIELVKLLARFPIAIETALEDYRPNALCDYLFDLAQSFTGFYDVCPVLKSEEPLRSSRLALCDLTSRVLGQGLGLLGIETVEAM